MDSTYFQQLVIQKQPHGVTVKIDLLMKIDKQKNFQALPIMINVTIMEISMYYQHSKVMELLYINNI
jgi:hypothetical protein